MISSERIPAHAASTVLPAEHVLPRFRPAYSYRATPCHVLIIFPGIFGCHNYWTEFARVDLVAKIIDIIQCHLPKLFIFVRIDIVTYVRFYQL